MGKSNQNLIQQNNSAEEFVKDLNRDEMRNGFLVTSHRKKLWNVQIAMIKEFDRICKKYNLRWFAYGGTLLGAVRHKGFIPWDDDVDLAMMRPDYEKFRKIVADEIRNYDLDFWYNYKLESEGAELNQDDGLSPVDIDWENKVYVRIHNWPFFPILKIRNSRTTQLQWFDRKHMNQGIFIDVFALDPVPPLSDKSGEEKFLIAKELFMATNYPRIVRKALENNQLTFIRSDELEKFLKLPFQKRALYFEETMAKIFYQSDYFGEIRNHCIGKLMSYKHVDFDKIIYMPFEEIELPIPSGYDDILTAIYGDWHKMMITPIHSSEWSVDIPYTEYYKKSALMR